MHSPGWHHGRSPWEDTRNHRAHRGPLRPARTGTCRGCSCWASCATSPQEVSRWSCAQKIVGVCALYIVVLCPQISSVPFMYNILYIYNNNIIQYIKLYIFYVFFHQTKGLQRHEYQAVGKLKLSAPTSSSFQVGPSSLKRAHKLFQYIRGTVVRWTLLQDSSSFAALPVTCVTHRLRKLQSHGKKNKKISLSLAELASSHLITLSLRCYKCNPTFSNPLGHSVSCGTRTHNTSRFGCFLMLCPLCNGSALMHLAPWCLRLSSSGCLLLRFSGRNLTVTNRTQSCKNNVGKKG